MRLRDDSSMLPEPVACGPLHPTQRQIAEVEKSALREALYEVTTAATGERGEKLLELIEEIRVKNGPKAAFDSIMKMMEFVTPKLQRVTVQDPNGNAPLMPIISVSFPEPVKVVQIDGE